MATDNADAASKIQRVTIQSIVVRRGNNIMHKLLLAALAVAAVTGVHAQGDYPRKPLRWIVPYAPGGGTDVIVRPIAVKVSELLGQSIVYENKGGAGGMIAAETVARAEPDGYTFLVVAPNTHVFATLLSKK